MILQRILVPQNVLSADLAGVQPEIDDAVFDGRVVGNGLTVALLDVGVEFGLDVKNLTAHFAQEGAFGRPLGSLSLNNLFDDAVRIIGHERRVVGFGC